MTDKEKIRAEIKRLQLYTMDEHMNYYSQEAKGEYNALAKIKAFIDSLKEEPVNEYLQKEVDNWRHEHFHGRRDMDAEGEYLERSSQYDLARHIASWQKQQDQETIKLAEDHAMLAGMEKMKEQMMKDAVEGVAQKNKLMSWISIERGVITKALEKYNDGDKLKLIIIKED